MFCPKCGKEIPEGTAFCPACGQPVNGPVVGAARAPKVFPEGKSHLVYWVLGLYLGSLGIHNFYLGEKTQGIIKLLITLLLGWTGIGVLAVVIWSLIEVFPSIKYSVKQAEKAGI